MNIFRRFIYTIFIAMTPLRKGNSFFCQSRSSSWKLDTWILEKDMNLDHIWYTTSISKAFLSCSLSKNRLHSKFTHTHSHNGIWKSNETKKTHTQKKSLYTKKKEKELEEKKQCCKTRAIFYNNTVLKPNSWKNTLS